MNCTTEGKKPVKIVEVLLPRLIMSCVVESLNGRHRESTYGSFARAHYEPVAKDNSRARRNRNRHREAAFRKGLSWDPRNRPRFMETSAKNAHNVEQASFGSPG